MAPALRTPTGILPRLPGRAAAFTLIELLLTLTLILLLFGAVIFSFSTLQRGASLDEGARQLESLLRFARAHATSTGRQVQISFEEDLEDGSTVPLGHLHVFWEPDPLTRPGIFEPLHDADTYVSGITDLISIEDVHPLEATAPGRLSALPGAAASIAPASASETAFTESFSFAPLNFYPDGSSDSLEIVLASRDVEDDRRMALQFVGVTGTVRHRLLSKDPVAEPVDSAEPNAEPASNVAAPSARREIGGAKTR